MKKIILISCFAYTYLQSNAQVISKPLIIAYYTGTGNLIDSFEVQKLTHIIYSFCHLKEGKLSVDTKTDSLSIHNLVRLKNKHPNLKIMLSLGGWGGCELCSNVFASEEGRAKFSKSVKEVNTFFKTDGIDLDWEYPAIEGFPGHLFQNADRHNFTDLIVKLRKELGNNNEISFAAGGFQKYLNESVEWEKIMPLVDRVNIMSYDLVNGFSTTTGHHTPIYSANNTEESTDRAVQYLLNLGIPAGKLIIGGAFYTRVWKDVENVNHGLYQKGVHIEGIRFKEYSNLLIPKNGWERFWDDKAKASYWYNSTEKKFATGDDLMSIKEKTNYTISNKLGGIMFWELMLDTPQQGLLDAIYTTINKK